MTNNYIFNIKVNNKSLFKITNKIGWIAQLVEQRTENPCVEGSNPSPATIFML